MGNFFTDLWDMGTKNTNFDPYGPVGATKQVVSGVTDLAKSPGYDTAAAGAKEAQAYLQQLSQQAWDRQMQGLQGALGSFGNYDALSAQMNPRHGGGPPPGAPPGLPPPGGVAPSAGPAVESRSGPGHFGGSGLPSGGAPPPLPPPTKTGYSPPGGPGWTPAAAPPGLPAPGSAPPALPPPGSGLAPPGLPPPGMPGSAPPALAPPDILTMLAKMTRSGQGHF